MVYVHTIALTDNTVFHQRTSRHYPLRTLFDFVRFTMILLILPIYSHAISP